MNMLMVHDECIVSSDESSTIKDQPVHENVNFEEGGSKTDTPSGASSTSTEISQSDFIPAYYDTETDTVYLSRFSDGRVAPVHVLDGIPRQLLHQGDTDELSGKVIVGFVFNDRFYTRGQALEALNEQLEKSTPNQAKPEIISRARY